VSPVRIIRDYSYTSTAFTGPGYLLAGDAACFLDPVFSTGVHLASLAGYLGAQAVDAVLTGAAPEAEALARYEAAYRGAFERYRRFLCFFYDHHVDRDSYFWTARRILSHAPPELSAREGFVRLMSGGGDWDAAETQLAREHERWAAGIRAGRIGAIPGLDVIRVRSTTQLTGLPASPAPQGDPARRARR
jgi:2-polyprenyl-6-methoxyphenol hydroxylase-like FAD-dependent oxidoreductase